MRSSGHQAEVVGWHTESYTSTSIMPSLAPLSQKPWKAVEIKLYILIEKSWACDWGLGVVLLEVAHRWSQYRSMGVDSSTALNAISPERPLSLSLHHSHAPSSYPSLSLITRHSLATLSGWPQGSFCIKHHFIWRVSLSFFLHLYASFKPSNHGMMIIMNEHVCNFRFL